MLPTNPAAANGKGFGIPFNLPDVITFKEAKHEEEENKDKIEEIEIENKYFLI